MNRSRLWGFKGVKGFHKIKTFTFAGTMFLESFGNWYKKVGTFMKRQNKYVLLQLSST